MSSHRSGPVLLWLLFMVALLQGCGGGGSQSSDDLSAGAVGTTGEMPVLLDEPPVAVNAGGYYTYTPSYVYGMPDEVSFSIRNKPDWAFFRPKTGQLFGSPRVPHIGTFEGVIITLNSPDGSLPLGPFDLRGEPPVEKPEPEPAPPEQDAAPTAPPPAPPASAPSKPAQPPAAPAPKPDPQPTPPAQKPKPKPAPEPDSTAKLKRERHPGHYISLNPWDTRQNMVDALRPGVAGLQKRYYWAALEPSYGKYDFELLEADLDLLESQGKRLVVFIEDKSFNGDIPTPGYLSSLTAENRKGGYTAVRWKPYVVERLKLLIDEIGKRYDGHPAFEGIALQESEPGFNSYVRKQYGYKPQIYKNALIDVLLSAAESIPTSTVFWYMNFFPENMNYIATVASTVGPAGVAVGGPDVLPDNYALARLTYPFYKKFEGKMVLFNSMQYNSYNHTHKNKKYGTKYWTMQQLYKFARDDLHVTYLFWNRKTQAQPGDSYMWKDALPVIKANPVIRPWWVDKLATD